MNIFGNHSRQEITRIFETQQEIYNCSSLNKLEGNTVSLGKLGSFTVNVKSDGAATADAVTAATIKGAKIVYRPGTELKNMLKTLKFEKKG
jgi:thioredoxin reductase